MRTSASIAFLAVAASSASAQTPYLAWTEDPSTNRWYGVQPAGSWSAAEADAIAQGGHLATLGSAVEDAFVRGFVAFLPSVPYWIGLNDLAVNGTFAWSSGEPAGFTNWAPGEPNHANPGVVMLDDDAAWRWSDTSTVVTTPRGIVERAAPPAAGWTFPRFHGLADMATHVGVGDVDGDGLDDVAAPAFSHDTVTVFRGRSDGRLGSSVTVALPSSPGAAWAATIGTFGGDAHPDVAVAASSFVYVLHGDGAGNFVLASALGGTQTYTTVVAADVDGDGIDDLISMGAQAAPVLSVFRALPDGSFASATYPTAAGGANIAHADLDGDGDVDLVVTSGTNSAASFYVHENDGTGAFTIAQSEPTAWYGGRAAIADYDDDGVPDLVLPTAGATRLLHGRGDCTFDAASPTFLPASHQGWAEAADFDGDGRVDLALTTTLRGDVDVYLNHGPNDLRHAARLPLGSEPTCVRAVRLGGDARPELLAAARNGPFIATYVNISIDCDADGVDDVTQIRGRPSLDLDGDRRLDACVVAGTPLCFGDGTGTACPCGANGAPGRGCATSTTSGGVLRANGIASVATDAVVLSASSLPATSIGLFIQGEAAVGGGLGAPFGDGLRCVAQDVRRLAIRPFSAGSARFGHGVAGDPDVSAIGGLPAAGGARWYQLWFRDAAPFCTPSTFNLTNAVRIDWTP